MQVSVFDTIKTWGLGGESYSSKVRRLGEFAPAAAAAAGRVDPEAGDIQDPLYGEGGGFGGLLFADGAGSGLQPSV